jgi:hypothetical protein
VARHEVYGVSGNRTPDPHPPWQAAGVHLRSDPITGVGGNQVVIDDPSGNPIELFEPTRTEARLTNR